MLHTHTCTQPNYQNPNPQILTLTLTLTLPICCIHTLAPNLTKLKATLNKTRRNFFGSC